MADSRSLYFLMVVVFRVVSPVIGCTTPLNVSCRSIGVLGVFLFVFDFSVVGVNAGCVFSIADPRK